MDISSPCIRTRRVSTFISCFAMALFASNSVLAQAPYGGDIADDRDALIDFYHATNGDDWDNNEGWLGDPGTECDWYGVSCQEQDGSVLGYGLVLVGNGLSGEIPDSFGDADGLTEFAAGYNEISGTWRMKPDSYQGLRFVFLSDTHLTGVQIESNAAPRLNSMNFQRSKLSQFPTGLQNLSLLRYLKLSFNDITGELPTEISQLQLKKLLAEGNRLGGSILPALQAMTEESDGADEQNILLDLRDNRFSGAIGEDAIAQSRVFDGWVNLCWNGMTPPNEQATEWLETEHVDRPFEQCLDKTIRDPDPSLSGSWYDPERPGEGFSIMHLDNGQTLVNWYTYPATSSETQGQAWLLGNRFLEHPGLDRLALDAPLGGLFSEGLANPGSYPIEMGGHLNLAWLENSGLFTEQDVYISDSTETIVQFEEMDQLTVLAGTTCDNQSPFQEYSGAWYNPDSSGEGFIVEVISENTVNVYWFTFQPDQSGDQAWMIGGGEFLEDGAGADPISTYSARAEVELLQPVGGQFGPAFDSEAVEARNWGSAEIRFDGNGGGHVIWDSEIEGYGSGNYSLQRLATPELADCN